MTDVIAAVVLPSAGVSGRGRGSAATQRKSVPMPRLAVACGSAPMVIYRVAAIDSKGRINDLAVPRALGWDWAPAWTCGKPAVSSLSVPTARACSA